MRGERATVELVDTVVDIGNSSGADIDKFATYGLTPRKAQKVGAPLIDECYASFECKLHDHRLVRRYSLFIWKIVAAHVRRGPPIRAPFTIAAAASFAWQGRQSAAGRRFKPEML